MVPSALTSMNVRIREIIVTAMSQPPVLIPQDHSFALVMQATLETVHTVPTLMNVQTTGITATTMLPALIQLVLLLAPVIKDTPETAHTALTHTACSLMREPPALS
jgi:hypothetical protein